MNRKDLIKNDIIKNIVDSDKVLNNIFVDETVENKAEESGSVIYMKEIEGFPHEKTKARTHKKVWYAVASCLVFVAVQGVIFGSLFLHNLSGPAPDPLTPWEDPVIDQVYTEGDEFDKLYSRMYEFIETTIRVKSGQIQFIEEIETERSDDTKVNYNNEGVIDFQINNDFYDIEMNYNINNKAYGLKRRGGTYYNKVSEKWQKTEKIKMVDEIRGSGMNLFFDSLPIGFLVSSIGVKTADNLTIYQVNSSTSKCTFYVTSDNIVEKMSAEIYPYVYYDKKYLYSLFMNLSGESDNSYYKIAKHTVYVHMSKYDKNVPPYVTANGGTAIFP